LRRLRDLRAEGWGYLPGGAAARHAKNSRRGRWLRGRRDIGVMGQEPSGLEGANQKDAGQEGFDDSAIRPGRLRRDRVGLMGQRQTRWLADCDVHLRAIRDHQFHRTNPLHPFFAVIMCRAGANGLIDIALSP
jgi:hypothetical protein